MQCNELSIEPAGPIQAERWQSESDWRIVDRALRAIAKRRAGLDAEELHWLRAAEAVQVWRPLGMVSALDYLERVFGYTPRVAEERLRTARALSELPALGAELASGRLPFTAVRELTRVVTPATEAAWIAAASGKNVREIEELVSGHRPGDRPTDPADPEVRTHVVRFELEAPTFALLRQARLVLDGEHGRRLCDDELVAALCNAVVDGASVGEPTGRAKFQVAITVCARCEQGWQEGGGASIPIDAAAVERARCEAQHIGSLDGDVVERAHQDIPPSTVRFVWRRDGGRCRIPGCRSARGLEIHHLVHRADGGGHEPSNLILACSACHLAHHRGALQISGTVDQLVVRRPGESYERSVGVHLEDSNAVQPRGDRRHDPRIAATESRVNDRNTVAATRDKASLANHRDTHVERRHAPVQASHRESASTRSFDVGRGAVACGPSERRDAPLVPTCGPTSKCSPHVGASAAPGSPRALGDAELLPRFTVPRTNDGSPHVG